MKPIHSRLLRTTAAALVLALYLLPAAPYASAGIAFTDATWENFTDDSNWNNGDNWNTESAPNGVNDKATFTNSTTTTIFLSERTSVAQITFQPGPSFGKGPVEITEGGGALTADAFTIHTNGSDLDFYGAGIINNSGKTQTIINDNGEEVDPTITFHNSSSAGNVTIVNADSFNSVRFIDTSSAGNALIINQAFNTEVYFGNTEGDSPTAANATIINQGDQSHVTFSNNASGGNATIINVSPTSYIDISRINGSSLTLGAIGGVGTVYLGSKNLIVGGNNLSTVFSGVITDGSPEIDTDSPSRSDRFFGGVGGSLTKTGTGTLTMAGANTYTGNTFVNGGTLAITGSILSPNVFVNSGGTLFVDGSIAGNAILNGGMIGGNGLIGGSLINNTGTVSPGHSPGTLRMNGNFTQGAGGTLIIQLASSSVFDKVIAGGPANLGGTLIIDPLTGFKLKRGETFEFLTANGGVNGTFSNVLQPDTGTILKFGLDYESNGVLIDAVMGSFASLPGLTPNEQAVANELDKIANDDRSSKLINFLAKQPLGALPGDFDKIAAEELTSVFTLGTSFDNLQILNLLRRNSDLRSGASGFSASGFQTTSGGTPSYSGGFTGPNGNDGKESKEMKTVAPEEKHWGFFITGVGDWVGVGGDYNARGYDIQTGGFTLGVDYKIGDHFAVGLMAGYVGTGVDLTDGGRVFVDGGKLGLYATAFAGGFYTDFAVTGGYSSYDMHRSALEGTARSDTDGGDLNVLVGTGYDWKVGGFSFGPTASFNYTYVGISGFTESGSLAPLSFGAQGQESIRSSFGFKASYDLKFGGISVKPEVSAAWQHEYGDTTYALDSSFASGAGNVFSVTGPRLGRDSALIGAGFSIQWNDRFSTYVYYDGELGRTNYNSQGVSGGFRFSF